MKAGLSGKMHAVLVRSILRFMSPFLSVFGAQIGQIGVVNKADVVD